MSLALGGSLISVEIKEAMPRLEFWRPISSQTVALGVEITRARAFDGRTTFLTEVCIKHPLLPSEVGAQFWEFRPDFVSSQN